MISNSNGKRVKLKREESARAHEREGENAKKGRIETSND